MLNIPGHRAYTCEGPTRRELMRIGSIGLMGLSLPHFFLWRDQAKAAEVVNKYAGARGFDSAKSVIMVFLQGGPSHIDIWDPKPDAPANIRGEFKPIKTKIPGTYVSEHMPMMAQHLDKATLIRSMSYTPNGLFNHTAAIYQMLTGYPPDKVSPSGQLEPPSPADFPTAGSHISKMKPPKDPVLPFVELPRPLQESGIIGKGGSAGFLGKAYDPYRMYQDPAKPMKIEDLSLRKEVPPERLKDRFELLKGINGSMPELEKALGDYAVDEYYSKAYDLVLSGKARDAMDLEKETRPRCASATAAHLRPEPAHGPPPDRGRHEIRPGELAVGGQRRSGDHGVGHARGELRPAEESALPETRPWPFGAARGHGSARAVERDHRGRGRRIWPQPAARRFHVRKLQLARRPRPLAVLLQRGGGRRRNRPRASNTASPMRPPRRPRRSRCTPTICWPPSTTRSASTRTWRSAIT